VTDWGNHRIQCFHADGRPLGSFGGGLAGASADRPSAAGSGPGAFRRPYDARARGNDLYVADTHNHRIQVFRNAFPDA